MTFRNVLHFGLLSGLLVIAGLCQSQEAVNLTGTVREAQTGLPLSSARVELLGTQNVAATDEGGRFQFSSLAPGQYEVKVTYIGYKPYLRPSVVVTWETTTHLDISLIPEPIELSEYQVRYASAPQEGQFAGGRIISQETLRREHPRNLADLLEKEGFVLATSDGSPGGSQSVSLRGSSTDQVLVLLDGRPLNASVDGVADLSRISLAEVRQVEIYPQAPSSLGAQAIGGVINVITLQPGLQNVALRVGYGGYGEKQGSVTLGQKMGEWPVLAIYEHREATGAYRFNIVPDDGLENFTRDLDETQTRSNAGYRRDLVTLKTSWSEVLDLSYRFSLLNRENPDYLPLPLLAHESTTDDQRQEWSMCVKGSDRWYRPKMLFSLERYRQEMSTDYGPDYPLLFRYSLLRGDAANAELSWDRPLDEKREASYGIGLRWERLESSDLEGGSADRLHEFGYMQVQGSALPHVSSFPQIGFFSGVRADFYEQQETFIHPRFGLEVSGGEAYTWTVRGELAGAYHLPSFNALFWQEDLQSRGNPDLKPERSLNREISAKFGARNWDVNLAYFHRQVWDLIYWQLDFDKKWKPLNLYRALIHGLEAGIQSRYRTVLGDSEASLVHRWMEAINQSGEPNTDGQLLPYRPKNATTLSLRQDFSLFSVDVAARWIGRRYTNVANTKSLSPYSVWDMGLTKTFLLNRRQTQITLRGEIRNLLNEGYRQIDRAPMPLREWWITISLEHQLND